MELRSIAIFIKFTAAHPMAFMQNEYVLALNENSFNTIRFVLFCKHFKHMCSRFDLNESAHRLAITLHFTHLDGGRFQFKFIQHA